MFTCSWSYFNSKSTSIPSQSTVLLQKSELTQLVKKCASFYEDQRFQYCFYKNPLQDTILSILLKLPQICVYNQHILSSPLLHHPPKPDLVTLSMGAAQSIMQKLWHTLWRLQKMAIMQTKKWGILLSICLLRSEVTRLDAIWYALVDLFQNSYIYGHNGPTVNLDKLTMTNNCRCWISNSKDVQMYPALKQLLAWHMADHKR